MKKILVFICIFVALFLSFPVCAEGENWKYNKTAESTRESLRERFPDEGDFRAESQWLKYGGRDEVVSPEGERYHRFDISQFFVSADKLICYEKEAKISDDKTAPFAVYSVRNDTRGGLKIVGIDNEFMLFVREGDTVYYTNRLKDFVPTGGPIISCGGYYFKELPKDILNTQDNNTGEVMYNDVMGRKSVKIYAYGLNSPFLALTGGVYRVSEDKVYYMKSEDVPGMGKYYNYVPDKLFATKAKVTYLTADEKDKLFRAVTDTEKYAEALRFPVDRITDVCGGVWIDGNSKADTVALLITGALAVVVPVFILLTGTVRLAMGSESKRTWIFAMAVGVLLAISFVLLIYNVGAATNEYVR